MQRAGRVLHAGADRLKASGLLRRGGNLLRRVVEHIQIGPVDVDGQALADESGEIRHAAGGDGDLTAAVGGGLLDLLADAHRLLLSCVLRHGDIADIAAVGPVRHAGKGAERTGHAAEVHHADVVDAVDREDLLHHAVRLGIGLRALIVLGRGDADLDAVGGHLRQDHDADAQHLYHAQRQKSHTQRQRYRPVGKAPAQRIAVVLLNALHDGVWPGLHTAQYRAGRGGDHRQRHDQRGHQAVGNRQRQRQEHFAHGAGGEDHRQKDAHSGQRGGDDRPAHLPGPLHRRARRGNAAVAHADDILHDDDAVVHQHADAEGQARERHHVEGQVGEIHQHQGKEHRERNADADDDRRPHVPQEERQHQDGQQRAEGHALDDAADDQRNILALVHQFNEVQLRIFREQLFDRLRAAAGHLVRAGGGAFVDAEHDAGAAVEVGIAQLGVVDDGDGGDVRHAHRADAVDIAQQRLRHVAGAAVFVAHAQQPGPALRVVNIARGHGKVLRIDQLGEGGCVHQRVQIGRGERLLALLVILGIGALQLGLSRAELLRRGGKAHRRVQLALGQLGKGGLQHIHQARHLSRLFRKAAHRFARLPDLGGELLRAVARRDLVHQRLALAQHGVDLLSRLHQIADGAAVQQSRGGRFQPRGQSSGALGEVAVEKRIVRIGQQLAHHRGQLHRRFQRFEPLGQVVCPLAQALRELLRRRIQPAKERGRKRIAELRLLPLELPLSCVHLSLGLIQRGARLGQGFVGLFQDPVVHAVDLLLIELDLHGLLHQSHARHAGDAVLPLEVRDDLFFDIVGQLVNVVPVAADCHIHRGDHVHTDLQDAGRAAVCRQRGGDLVDRAGDVDHGAVHIAAVGKLQLHHRIVLAAHRGHLLHVFHRAERLLQRRADLELHLLRAGAGIGRDDHQIREVDRGQQVGRHPRHGHDTQRQHHDDRHQDRERFFYAEFFHEHRYLSAAASRQQCDNTTV